MLTTYRRILSEPGTAALQRHRPGRAAADLDGRARHRAAGAGQPRAPTASRVPCRPPTWSRTPLLAIVQGRLVDTLGQARVLGAASAGLRGRHGAADLVGGGATGRSGGPTPSRRWRARRCRRSARACGPAGPRAGRAGATCRRRTPWRPWSTRRSSSSARSWSRCWRPPWTRSPGWRRGRGRRGREPGLQRAAPHRAARPPPRPQRRAAAADAVAHRRAAGRGLRGAGRPVRCRRGDHGRVRRGAGRADVRRPAARPLGAGQPGGRGRHRRHPLAPRTRGAGAVGCARDGVRDGAAALPRVGLDDGAVLLVGGRGDRAHPGRPRCRSPSAPCRGPGSPRGWRSCRPAWWPGSPPGATASGFVVDHAGASAAYLVSLAAGVLAALAAQALPRGHDDDAPAPPGPGPAVPVTGHIPA